MTRISQPQLTSFDKGIVKFTTTAETKDLKLPELGPLVTPSDAKIEVALPKLWKAASLENTMHESFLPKTKDKESLNPGVYQRKLKDAKGLFRDYINKIKKDKEGNKKRKNQFLDQEDEDIFEEVIRNLEELEDHQELLWMLRQVVHIA